MRLGEFRYALNPTGNEKAGAHVLMWLVRLLLDMYDLVSKRSKQKQNFEKNDDVAAAA